MKPILELNQVRVKGTTEDRLKRVELSINYGERVAVLGASGAGKSTLLSVANGSIKPDSGEVFWKGVNIKQLPRKKLRSIGTLWQDLRLIEELNVTQNINAGALGRHNLIWSLRNLIGIIEPKECIACLEAAGLSKSLLKAKLKELSGGQLQRVAIARLFRQRAQLLLADEPISSLDPTLTQRVLELLLSNNNQFSAQGHESVVIALHRPDLINLFDRVIGLRMGEIVLDQPSKGLNPSEVSWLY